jgi:prophage tail gpP-like protein
VSVTITINGQVYTRILSLRVGRNLKRACSDFQFETPLVIGVAIARWASCVIADQGETILTGYVDDFDYQIVPENATVTVRGRSKTEDLVDCMPLLATNQFAGSTLDAIARAVAAPFGINVVVSAPMGNPFPDATFERSETAYGFLERLARQRGVLLTDDAQGDLVLTTLGTARAPGNLESGLGGNIDRARGNFRGSERFSEYTIRSQVPITDDGEVQTAVEGIAYDNGVPRYRPWAGIAESALLPGDAQKRAQWEAAHRLGESLQATLTVPEWRAPNATGALWQVNQLVNCNVPRLDNFVGDFLVAGIDYRLDSQGKRCDILVAPPQAFAPEPLTDLTADWSGIVNVTQGGAGGGSALPPP